MTETTVTMLGLGRMGSALARGFRKGGARVTVWNRDPSKAEALRGEGFAVARSQPPDKVLAKLLRGLQQVDIG